MNALALVSSSASQASDSLACPCLSSAAASFSSVTIYFNIDGLQHKLTGARGTMSLDFTRDGRPAMKFSFTGLGFTGNGTFGTACSLGRC